MAFSSAPVVAPKGRGEGKRRLATPVMMLSDLHIEEPVHPEQVGQRDDHVDAGVGAGPECLLHDLQLSLLKFAQGLGLSQFLQRCCVNGERPLTFCDDLRLSFEEHGRGLSATQPQRWVQRAGRD